MSSTLSVAQLSATYRGWGHRTPRYSIEALLGQIISFVKKLSKPIKIVVYIVDNIDKKCQLKY